MTNTELRVAIGQISPVLLNREQTLAKVEQQIEAAADAGAALVCFGEALVPGYPVWLSRTGGAAFDDADQKHFHALYSASAVDIDAGHLDAVRSAALRRGLWVVLGIIERPRDRGGQSLYCSCVTIDAAGEVRSVHRKLMPTYEERLSWSTGDGHGLRVHDLPPFRLGALNCWENWMPLARASLYAQGETLHVAIWPGSRANTGDITRFIARESRSWVISASGFLTADDIPPDLPRREELLADPDDSWHNGGSAIARPDGSWLIEPRVGEECLIVADLDLRSVQEARQNFDPSGHYSRPDVFSLRVDRRRQTIATFSDDSE